MLTSWNTMQTLFKRFSQVQQKAFSWFFLQCIYLIGLGLTSIFGRALGHRFMNVHQSKSTWKRHPKEVDIGKMF
jgi:hypothetical protein